MGDVYLCRVDSKKFDINLTLENKRFTSNRNSKENSATKYNLLTSDKKRKTLKIMSLVLKYLEKRNKME